MAAQVLDPSARIPVNYVAMNGISTGVSDQELEELMAGGESDRVEFKPSLADKGEIYKAICAFANDLPNHKRPGVIFVGLNNDGTCANLPITDERLRELADMRSQGKILPFPTMLVEKRNLRGCELAVIIVYPSKSPPVRYDGRVLIRSGSRRDIATRDDERILNEKRLSGDIPFDLQSVITATLNDLDLDFFRRIYLLQAIPPDVLEQNERNTEEQLISLRFLTPDKIPTVLGILTLAFDPRQFIPADYIQFLRIDGTELTDPIKDSKEIDGPLPDLLRRLDEILEINISVSRDITSNSTEIKTPDYPIVALRQIALNAVLHRTYEATNAPVRICWFADRIEIHSPGGPFGLVNKENFGQGLVDYRNPNLAEVMKVLGYVQRFGVGIQMARSELEKNGNPPLEFAVEDNYVLAIMRRTP